MWCEMHESHIEYACHTHTIMWEIYSYYKQCNTVDHRIFIVCPILTNEAAFLLLESDKTQFFIRLQNN